MGLSRRRLVPRELCLSGKRPQLCNLVCNEGLLESKGATCIVHPSDAMKSCALRGLLIIDVPLDAWD